MNRRLLGRARALIVLVALTTVDFGFENGICCQ